jgi:hypothetical protein
MDCQVAAESQAKHEPASDVDTAVMDSLKALDLNRPIREADISLSRRYVCFTPESGHCRATVGCPLFAKSGHQLLRINLHSFR